MTTPSFSFETSVADATDNASLSVDETAWQDAFDE